MTATLCYAFVGLNKDRVFSVSVDLASSNIDTVADNVFTLHQLDREGFAKQDLILYAVRCH